MQERRAVQLRAALFCIIVRNVKASRHTVRILQTVEIAILCVAAVFLAMHYAHLRADFPNHSPWVDWAKYTDEGWYGDAAIRYYLRGKWHLPGDFNPAAALPVWPLMEGLLFGVTGVGVVPARALSVSMFVVSAVIVYVLMRRRPSAHAGFAGDLAPAFAVLMLAVSPFLFAFSRLAIVEPLLVLLTLLAMLVAWTPLKNGREWWRRIVLGLLMALMIGTKTTAVCLMPAVLWMLWCGEGRRWRKVWPAALTACATAGAVIALYLAAVVKSGHWADFKYLFDANQYTGITRETFWSVIAKTLHDTQWTGPAVACISLGVVVIANLFRRRIWHDALFTGCVLWVAGYFSFLAYHASLQPRYYMVIAVPIVLLALRGLEDVCSEWKRIAVPAAAGLLLIASVQASRMTAYVRHPEYTFARAAEKVKRVVLAEKNHSNMVLSISGSDLTLMTGLPSICDDFGTLDLDQRVAKYRPGWFIAWNYVEDDKMDALTGLYRLTRVAEFPAMDDPDRNLLIVYRLDAKK
ncbi:MAG: glycosyltransferase family 39 protein [Acidobacteria bacterium]|nr:glycosyltransferase family 39 protein [Acidobacteriota bacterium]